MIPGNSPEQIHHGYLGVIPAFYEHRNEEINRGDADGV
jgi:hypothetical protein